MNITIDVQIVGPRIYAHPKEENQTSKKENYKETLVGLLDKYLETCNETEIRKYLASNSNLPGPRGNLELAYLFADVVEEFATRHPNKMWKLASALTNVSANEAPVNDPKEFLPFCGAVAIGAIAAAHEGFIKLAFPLLKKLANDSRWRMREGVAMGLQKLSAKKDQYVLEELNGWITTNEWLVMRAVAAGVAEPALLKNKQVAMHALALHQKIFSKILTSKDRKTSQFKTLRQALGYSLSVVVYSIPNEGFEYMRQLTRSQDDDILWVIRENLKKNRLIKNFPNDVAEVKKLLP